MEVDAPAMHVCVVCPRCEVRVIPTDEEQDIADDAALLPAPAS